MRSAISLRHDDFSVYDPFFGPVDSLQNLGEHFADHVLKYKEWANDAEPITDILSYIKKANAMIKNPSISWGIAIVEDPNNPGLLNRWIMNYDTGEFVSVYENGPQAGAIKTFFKKDKLDRAGRKAFLLKYAKTLIQSGT